MSFLQMKHLATAQCWFGGLLFIVGYTCYRNGISETIPPGMIRSFVVGAKMLLLFVLNLIFLYYPRTPKGVTPGRGVFQLLAFYALLSLVVLFIPRQEAADFITMLHSKWDDNWLLFLLSGVYARLKYQLLLDRSCVQNFENIVNLNIRRWRFWQIYGLFFIGYTLLLCDAEAALLLLPIGLTILVVIYIKIRRHVHCLQCGHDQSKLLLAPAGRRIPGALLLPRHLPQEIRACPDCGFSFAAIPDVPPDALPCSEPVSLPRPAKNWKKYLWLLPPGLTALLAALPLFVGLALTGVKHGCPEPVFLAFEEWYFLKFRNGLWQGQWSLACLLLTLAALIATFFRHKLSWPKRFGWIGIYLLTLAAAVGLLLPQLGAASERAKRIACGSNLKQIYLQLAVYAQDHAGQLPQRLETLRELDYLADPVAYRCNSRRENAAGFSDYCYYGKSHTINDPPFVLLEDRKHNHPGDYRNRLWSNGRLENNRQAHQP